MDKREENFVVKLVFGGELKDEYALFALDNLYNNYPTNKSNGSQRSYIKQLLSVYLRHNRPIFIYYDLREYTIAVTALYFKNMKIAGTYSIDVVFTNKINELIKEYEENNSDIQRSVL